jgi:hypothetical protein
MRDTPIVAFGAGGIGAVLGAVAVLAFARPPAAPQAGTLDPDVLAAAIGRVLSKSTADVRRDIAALRDDLAATRPAEGVPDVRTAGRSASPSPDDAVPRTRVLAAKTDPGADAPFDDVLPPANTKRLEAAAGWDDHPDLHRKWMFVDERTCLAWFGAPDRVDYDGTERWHYYTGPDETGDGKPDGMQEIMLVFQRGRLVNIAP